MSLVLNYIINSFWAMLPSRLDVMFEVANREAALIEELLVKGEAQETKPETLLTKKGDKLAGSRYTEVRDGVAIIDVNGPIAKRMNFFTEICYGGTSTEHLAKDLRTAFENPNVHSIVLNIDSPGGEAFGINELANLIYANRGVKPIKAYASGYCCSGAYWIASATDEIIADASSLLGSIGVVTVWTDDSEKLRREGTHKETFTSSNARKKRLNLHSVSDRAEFQKQLDGIEKVFLDAVARNRKLTVSQIINDFNEGSAMAGHEAVKVRMADRTGSLEGVISELQRHHANSGRTFRSENALQSKEKDMNLIQSLKNLISTAEAGEKIEASAVETKQEETASASSAAKPEATDETAKLRAELETSRKNEAEAKAREEKTKREKVNAELETFVSEQITANKLYPAEKEDLLASLVQASVDDEERPLETGSRVATIKSQIEKRKAHNLTEEVVSSEATKVLIATQSEGGTSDGVTNERKVELMKASTLGQASLKLVKDK